MTFFPITTLDNYSTAALRTKTLSKDIITRYLLFGLAGETGEVLEKSKKLLRNKNVDDIFTYLKREEATEDREIFLKELGDVLWYIAVIADEVNSSLEEVANLNINKLASRVTNGTLLEREDSDHE